MAKAKKTRRQKKVLRKLRKEIKRRKELMNLVSANKEEGLRSEV